MFLGMVSYVLSALVFVQFYAILTLVFVLFIFVELLPLVNTCLLMPLFSSVWHQFVPAFFCVLSLFSASVPVLRLALLVYVSYNN